MINMFNEKFFIFIWFWMCFLWLLTLGNGLIWTWHLFNRHSRYKFVLKQLSVSKRSVQHFAQNHLGADGILILRLISHNCGDYIVSEILAQFWTDYQHLDFSTFNSPRNYEMSESQVAVNERLIGSIRISETPTKEAPNDNNLESKLALKSLSKILTKQTDTERRERVKAREMTKDPNDLLF